MKKYRFVESKEEVKFGDYLCINVLLDDESCKELLNADIIEEFNTFDCEDVIKHLSNRKNIDGKEFIANLFNINKRAAIMVIKKEIALMLDDKYDGHIRYSNILWGFTSHKSEPFIVALGKEMCLNYPIDKHAVFRSEEDALEAIRILEQVIKKFDGK